MAPVVRYNEEPGRHLPSFHDMKVPHTAAVVSTQFIILTWRWRLQRLTDTGVIFVLESMCPVSSSFCVAFGWRCWCSFPWCADLRTDTTTHTRTDAACLRLSLPGRTLTHFPRKTFRKCSSPRYLLADTFHSPPPSNLRSCYIYLDIPVFSTGWLTSFSCPHTLAGYRSAPNQRRSQRRQVA